jgi:hypothetical protein
VGWATIVGSNYKFIRGQFQIGIIFKKHLTSCNVSKCPYGSQDIKKETNLFISMSFGIFVS